MDTRIREIIKHKADWFTMDEAKRARFLLKEAAGQNKELVKHSKRVAKAVKAAWGSKNDALVAAALLHDVVEDTEATMGDIRFGFLPRVAETVDILTRREGQGYEAYIERVAKHPAASIVKTADLRDHLAPGRLWTMPSESYRRRCCRALGRLLKADVLLSQALYRMGATGLANTDGECGCAIGDLAPCDCLNVAKCEAACLHTANGLRVFSPVSELQENAMDFFVEKKVAWVSRHQVTAYLEEHGPSRTGTIMFDLDPFDDFLIENDPKECDDMEEARKALEEAGHGVEESRGFVTVRWSILSTEPRYDGRGEDETVKILDDVLALDDNGEIVVVGPED